MKNFLKNFLLYITNETEISRTWRKIFALFFAILAIIFGSLWYEPSTMGKILEFFLFPFHPSWINKHYQSQLSFKFPPSFLNSLYGLILCIPLYLRNFISFQKLSVFSYLSFIFNFTLFAVIVQLIFGVNGTFSYDIFHLVFISTIIISWLGMRSIAGIGWIIIFCLGIIKLILIDYRLKHFGYFFILCGFSSFLFQITLSLEKTSPKDFFKNIVNEFRGIKNNQGEFIKENINETIYETSKITKNITKKII